MIFSIFNKTILLDADEVLSSPPGTTKMKEIVCAYCKKNKLDCSFISERVVEMDGIEYDMIPSRLFRGTYSVRLRRR